MDQVITAWCACVVAILEFVYLGGLPTLNPRYVEWLQFGDASQAQHGWRYFRQEDLLIWPITAIPRYLENSGMTIVLTGTVPLVAVPLKYLLYGVDAEFQWYGWWLFACFVLNALSALYLVKVAVRQWAVQLFGVAVFTISPLLLHRANFGGDMHLSLMAHFVPITALALVARKVEPLSSKWLFLLLVGGLINPYLAAMALSVYLPHLANCGIKILINRKKVTLPVVKIGASLLIVAAVVLVFGIYVPGSRPTHVFGFGFFKADLISPFNSLHYIPELNSGTRSWSRAFSGISGDVGSSEGFAFIGLVPCIVLLANLIRIVVSRVSSIQTGNRFETHTMRCLIALFVVSIPATIYAQADKLAIGKWKILTFKYPDFLMSVAQTFRVTGRFIWILSYCLILLSIVIIDHLRLRPIALVSLCFVLLGVQVADSRHVAALFRERFSCVECIELKVDPPVLDEKILSSMLQDASSVDSLPSGTRANYWNDVLKVISAKAISTSLGYSARPNLDWEIGVERLTWGALRSGNIGTGKIVLISLDKQELHFTYKRLGISLSQFIREFTMVLDNNVFRLDLYPRVLVIASH